MSSAEATFAVATAIDKHREATEKQTKVLQDFAEALNAVILSLNFQRASTVPASRPAMPTVPGVEVKVEWKPFKDKPGHWTFSKSNPLLRDTLEAAPNKTLEHGGFKYRLSGEQDMFIQRFPLGGAKS
jgi:hypothetical protein